jgi:serine phosphatase RsbU (regulator of sigma subunit)
MGVEAAGEQFGAEVGEEPVGAGEHLVRSGAELFTSCLYAHLDLAGRRVTLATAGHPPPIMRRPGHDARPVDMTPGPLLGIDPDVDFPVTELDLTPGLMLALYTDGLVETPGTDIEDSIAELAQHLGDADDRDLDALIDTLLRKAGTDWQRTDDVALLILHHTGTGF